MLGAIKSALVDIVLRPRGLAACGDGTRMAFPRRLRGHAHIRLGTNVRIDSHAWLEAFVAYQLQRFEPEIVIRDNVTIGRHATITAASRIELGEGCLLSEGVYISDHGHDVMTAGRMPLAQRPLILQGDVRIGAYSFLGFRSCVLPGVMLGEGCIVGAHAVVTRSFGPGSVLAGCPARLIRTIEGYSE